jgi:hypothetical protein
MLINKSGYSKDDIVSFKLVNGDEIVAKIVEVNDNNYVISKPTTAMPSARGLGLIQSLFTCDLEDSMTLEKQHVMLHALTQNDVKNHYIQTTTGIQPVSAGNKIIT